jgi:hypothetical protein
LEDCEETVSARYWTVQTACDVVAHPELTTECAFLTEVPPDEGTGGQGGQSATEDDRAETSQGGAPLE